MLDARSRCFGIQPCVSKRFYFLSLRLEHFLISPPTGVLDSRQKDEGETAARRMRGTFVTAVVEAPTAESDACCTGSPEAPGEDE